MARLREDDSLEPILPRHPPTAAEESPAASGSSSDLLDPAAAGSATIAGRPAWERLVLLACAVVATLALVVSAVRLSAIAEAEELEACQARAYALEQIEASSRGRFGNGADQTLREELAKCHGVDPPVDADRD